MLKYSLRAAALLAALLLVGCKRQPPPPLPRGVAPVDNSTRLKPVDDLKLGDWLDLPRSEQAKLMDEWTETVEKQLAAIRTNPLSLDMLPKLLPPLTVAVFDKAKFDPKVGLTLPPYVEPEKPDAGVALHLARFGDYDAALKLAPETFRSRLVSLKPSKNYSVEWSRLVSLLQISAQLKLATGDTDGAIQLAAIHQQLGKLLDSKTASGPLGSVLLSAGKHALEASIKPLRDRKHNKQALAKDIEELVKNWGEMAASTPALPFGSPVNEVSALFGCAAVGKAVFADTPQRVARVADLLGLPLPREGLQVVAAFLDTNDQLAEWHLAYRSRIDTLYATPEKLAFRLTETGYTANKENYTTNLRQQVFVGPQTQIEVTRTNRSPALGGYVRVTAAKNAPTAASTRPLRDFGPVHLDRGFEVTRLVLNPRQNGSPLSIKTPAVMQKMAQVLQTPTPMLVLLMREKNADLIQLFEMAWPVAGNPHALDKLLPSLWDDYGPARIEDIEDPTGSYLAFTWESKETRVRLRLAYDEAGPVLSARDLQPADKLAARAELARQLEQQERLARLKDSKSEEWLARSPGRVNDLNLAALKLGISKSEVEKVLPKGASYRRKDLPDGVSLTILTNADKLMPYWARQLLVRYQDNKVVEIRVRYQNGPTKAKKGSGDPLLQTFVEASGAPEPITPTWANLWSDLPGAAKPKMFRWRDDRTLRTFQSDEGGKEVILRDRPPEMTTLEIPPWAFVSTGLSRVKLGDERAAVEAFFKSPVTTSNDGGEVYRTPESSPYEMLIIWYQNDRVVRLRAVHREPCGKTPKEVIKTLNEAWGRDTDNLGYVCRQQGERGLLLGAYWWHDDLVRVQTSVQSTDQGPRLMTEWLYFATTLEPVSAKQRDVSPP